MKGRRRIEADAEEGGDCPEVAEQGGGEGERGGGGALLKFAHLGCLARGQVGVRWGSGGGQRWRMPGREQGFPRRQRSRFCACPASTPRPDIIFTRANIISTRANLISTRANIISTRANMIFTRANMISTRANLISTPLERAALGWSGGSWRESPAGELRGVAAGNQPARLVSQGGPARDLTSLHPSSVCRRGGGGVAGSGEPGPPLQPSTRPSLLRLCAILAHCALLLLPAHPAAHAYWGRMSGKRITSRMVR
jgi:hypothetical protein